MIPPPAIAAYRDALPAPLAEGLYNHMWGRAEFTCTGTLKDYDGQPLLEQLDPKRTLFVAGQNDEARPATVANFAIAAGAGSRKSPTPRTASCWTIPPPILACSGRGWPGKTLEPSLLVQTASRLNVA